MSTAPQRSKADLVTEHLRARLQAGHPGPGQRLVVSRVATELGVSKIPVREAVTRLAGEGLLRHIPNVGPVVPWFSADEVHETALMRVALEDVAFETAVLRHDDQSLALLDRIVGDSGACCSADFPLLNVRFHLAMIEPTPYRELHRSIRSLLERAQRYAIVHSVPHYRPQAEAEHAYIVAAVRSRDIQLVRDLNRRHVLGAAERLIARIEAGESGRGIPGPDA